MWSEKAVKVCYIYKPHGVSLQYIQNVDVHPGSSTHTLHSAYSGPTYSATVAAVIVVVIVEVVESLAVIVLSDGIDSSSSISNS